MSGRTSDQKIWNVKILFEITTEKYVLMPIWDHLRPLRTNSFSAITFTLKTHFHDLQPTYSRPKASSQESGQCGFMQPIRTKIQTMYEFWNHLMPNQIYPVNYTRPSWNQVYECKKITEQRNFFLRFIRTSRPGRGMTWSYRPRGSLLMWARPPHFIKQYRPQFFDSNEKKN